jgi:hypothetical protein
MEKPIVNAFKVYVRDFNNFPIEWNKAKPCPIKTGLLTQTTANPLLIKSSQLIDLRLKKVLKKVKGRVVLERVNFPPTSKRDSRPERVNLPRYVTPNQTIFAEIKEGKFIHTVSGDISSILIEFGHQCRDESEAHCQCPFYLTINGELDSGDAIKQTIFFAFTPIASEGRGKR